MLKKKKILLLGAGHANIQVLHELSKIDRSFFELTLISDEPYSSYSGMIPSFLAGHYKKKQLQFDLQKICNRYKYTFIQGEVMAFDTSLSKIQLTTGSLCEFDICSINIGIKPQGIPAESDAHIIYLKPISQLLNQWEQLLQKESPTSLTIIGGGPAAFEIAVACRLRLNDLKVKIRLIAGLSGLLSNENSRTHKKAVQSLQKLHIELVDGLRVEKIHEKTLTLSDGQILDRQHCLVGTSAAAPLLFRQSKLPITEAGFLKIDENLNVLGSKSIFAAGDCSEFVSHRLPKAGVYAVRQGPILAHNITALLDSSKIPIRYRPQPSYLKILVCGKDEAIATYKNFSFRGWLAWRLKDYIDRRFMKLFS